MAIYKPDNDFSNDNGYSNWYKVHAGGISIDLITRDVSASNALASIQATASPAANNTIALIDAAFATGLESEAAGTVNFQFNVKELSVYGGQGNLPINLGPQDLTNNDLHIRFSNSIHATNVTKLGTGTGNALVEIVA